MVASRNLLRAEETHRRRGGSNKFPTQSRKNPGDWPEAWAVAHMWDPQPEWGRAAHRPIMFLEE